MKKPLLPSKKYERLVWIYLGLSLLMILITPFLLYKSFYWYMGEETLRSIIYCLGAIASPILGLFFSTRSLKYQRKALYSRMGELLSMISRDRQLVFGEIIEEIRDANSGENK